MTRSRRIAGKKVGDQRSGKSGKKRRYPLYVQVVNSLKDGIIKGIYPVNTQLPSEELLSKRYTVSRHTIREALRRLRDDGLVSSRQGAGTVVIRSAVTQPYVHEVASINDLISYAAALRFQPDTITMMVADQSLAKRIGSEEGQRWLKLEGFRYSTDSGKLVCWMEIFVHADYAGVGRILDRHYVGSIFELIESMYAERIAEVDQILRMSPMPSQPALILGTPPNELAVEVFRTFRLASGKIAEVSIAHYPAHDFKFSLKLRRLN